MNQLNKLIEQYPGDQKEILKGQIRFGHIDEGLGSQLHQSDFTKSDLSELVEGKG